MYSIYKYRTSTNKFERLCMGIPTLKAADLCAQIATVNRNTDDCVFIFPEDDTHIARNKRKYNKAIKIFRQYIDHCHDNDNYIN